ncbi:DUF1127 domain-containing protein [Rhizobium grahamii]|uniref:DUF1127 domain-containing protein n=1 Tax=Rhizobium grahamii TaxID=1120045 RepID=A0A5Q0CA72_9HYPH|nr:MULTISPECIES: DUF1127 domain-containing protein [Rhizobium]QFY60910.1 DUF1127 domain-containing protein [Rhizobium grahamii]QRM49941.1 DUF1127 domain-containing protein [Rhizobium sp. BG6]
MADNVGEQTRTGVEAGTAAGLWGRVVRYFRQLAEKRQGRRSLAELTGDQLDDIGVTRSEARAEIGKSWFRD